MTDGTATAAGEHVDWTGAAEALAAALLTKIDCVRRASSDRHWRERFRLVPTAHEHQLTAPTGKGRDSNSVEPPTRQSSAESLHPHWAPQWLIQGLDSVVCGGPGSGSRTIARPQQTDITLGKLLQRQKHGAQLLAPPAGLSRRCV